MTLYDLEKAIRPQFMWARHESKRLQCDKRREITASIGIVVFVGVAHSLSFTKKDIVEYLGIEAEGYDTKLKLFNESWTTALHFMALPDTHIVWGGSYNNYPCRMYYKTQLVLNSLRISFFDQMRVNDLFLSTKKPAS